jgi:hypothetical protein
VRNKVILVTAMNAALLGFACRMVPSGEPGHPQSNGGSGSLTTGPSAALAHSLWKSETTGNEYRVDVVNDTLRAEWVNVPAEISSHGGYVRTVCRRSGSKWQGTSASLLPCSTGEGAKERVVNWCHLETRTEIDLITSDRITGHGESVKRVDCEHCQVVERGWTAWVWTPKP